MKAERIKRFIALYHESDMSAETLYEQLMELNISSELAWEICCYEKAKKRYAPSEQPGALKPGTEVTRTS